MKLEQWKKEAQAQLEQAGIEVSEANIEISFLLEHCLQLSRSQLLISGNQKLSQAHLLCLNQFVARRCQREPLAHLLGRWEFWGLPFKVTKETLIPRADTEILVEESLGFLKQILVDTPPVLLNDASASPTHWVCDVGTGTGCIGLSVASEYPQFGYYLCDISKPALSVAQQNYQTLLKQSYLSTQTHFQFHLASLLELFYRHPQSIRPSLIISNPPYIKRDDAHWLMPEVKNYDPKLALFDEAPDGLALTRQLIKQAYELLPLGGALMVEVGYDQTEKTEIAFIETGFVETNIRIDYGGQPRVVKGFKRK